MYRDPRGGHNRKRVNENFFKTWSPEMAYVLGFIFADGAVEDVRKSSRTCYIHLASNDKPLLEQVRLVLSSTHRIYLKKNRWTSFEGKLFYGAQRFYLRIGNKSMYQDLLNLGVPQRKSLTMTFPDVPPVFLHLFIRGYFDGDGCLNVTWLYKASPRVKLIFTSGSKVFLEQLKERLSLNVGALTTAVYKNGKAFRLRYGKRAGLRVLEFMYKDLEMAPYLIRKYRIYQKLLGG